MRLWQKLEWARSSGWKPYLWLNLLSEEALIVDGGCKLHWCCPTCTESTWRSSLLRHVTIFVRVRVLACLSMRSFPRHSICVICTYGTRQSLYFVLTFDEFAGFASAWQKHWLGFRDYYFGNSLKKSIVSYEETKNKPRIYCRIKWSIYSKTFENIRIFGDIWGFLRTADLQI